MTNLRFDDTNPAKEETEYVDGIMADIRWLGFDWKGGLFFASEYYQQCYDIAVDWIKRGLAYVCDSRPKRCASTAAPSPSLAGTALIGTAPWRKACACLRR